LMRQQGEQSITYSRCRSPRRYKKGCCKPQRHAEVTIRLEWKARDPAHKLSFKWSEKCSCAPLRKHIRHVAQAKSSQRGIRNLLQTFDRKNCLVGALRGAWPNDGTATEHPLDEPLSNVRCTRHKIYLSVRSLDTRLWSIYQRDRLTSERTANGHV
jgi:hypothetical protein